MFIWIFDLSLKTNSLQKSFTNYSVGSWAHITLSLNDISVKNQNSFNIITHSNKLIKFFSTQSLKFFNLRAKKNNKFFIKTRNYGINWLKPFVFCVQTLIPYLKASWGLNKFTLLSNDLGNFTFSFTDVSFFATKLDDFFLNWNRWIYVNFNILFKNVNYGSLLNKIIFKKFIFLKGCWARIIWSSIGLKCSWGHGGWFKNIYINKIFFKNYKLLWKI